MQGRANFIKTCPGRLCLVERDPDQGGGDDLLAQLRAQRDPQQQERENRGKPHGCKLAGASTGSKTVLFNNL